MHMGLGGKRLIFNNLLFNYYLSQLIDNQFFIKPYPLSI